jgi:alkylhydroperoxidase family enzyme
MAFVDTVPAEAAVGATRDMYERQTRFFGYLPNYAPVFSARPEIMTLWARLQAGIKSSMSPELFALVTLVAAHELRSSYCCLAHGKKLTDRYSDREITIIVQNDGVGVLQPAEVAAVRHARRVVRHGYQVDACDVAELRAAGYSDGDVFDITAAAAARAFFAKLVDALGAEPDVAYAELGEGLIESLAVGRAFPSATVCSQPVTSSRTSS